MKPIQLFTSLLAVATVAFASCSAPRLAQENSGTDDVYNSVAQAKEYVQPAPRQATQYRDTLAYEDDYGISDPYYDMDYSSRINRFYYGSPFRPYYDPFYYDYYGYNSFSPWYSPGFSMSFGWGWGNSYFNNWNSPYYGWGIYSPYYAWSPFYGGGYLGGGYYGGGYYGGGYVNNLRGTTNYGARPDRGRENGTGYTSRQNTGNYIGRGATRSSNGIISSDRSRAERYNPNRGTATNPNSTGRTSRTTNDTYRPQTRSNTNDRPSYSPPPTSRSNPGASQSGGGGGGSRSQRGGGRN